MSRLSQNNQNHNVKSTAATASATSGLKSNPNTGNSTIVTPSLDGPHFGYTSADFKQNVNDSYNVRHSHGNSHRNSTLSNTSSIKVTTANSGVYGSSSRFSDRVNSSSQVQSSTGGPKSINSNNFQSHQYGQQLSTIQSSGINSNVAQSQQSGTNSAQNPGTWYRSGMQTVQSYNDQGRRHSYTVTPSQQSQSRISGLQSAQPRSRSVGIDSHTNYNSRLNSRTSSMNSTTNRRSALTSRQSVIPDLQDFLPPHGPYTPAEPILFGGANQSHVDIARHHLQTHYDDYPSHIWVASLGAGLRENKLRYKQVKEDRKGKGGLCGGSGCFAKLFGKKTDKIAEKEGKKAEAVARNTIFVLGMSRNNDDNLSPAIGGAALYRIVDENTISPSNLALIQLPKYDISTKKGQKLTDEAFKRQAELEEDFSKQHGAMAAGFDGKNGNPTSSTIQLLMKDSTTISTEQNDRLIKEGKKKSKKLSKDPQVYGVEQCYVKVGCPLGHPMADSEDLSNDNVCRIIVDPSEEANTVQILQQFREDSILGMQNNYTKSGMVSHSGLNSKTSNMNSSVNGVTSMSNSKSGLNSTASNLLNSNTSSQFQSNLNTGNSRISGTNSRISGTSNNFVSNLNVNGGQSSALLTSSRYPESNAFTGNTNEKSVVPSSSATSNNSTMTLASMVREQNNKNVAKSGRSSVVSNGNTSRASSTISNTQLSTYPAPAANNDYKSTTENHLEIYLGKDKNGKDIKLDATATSNIGEIYDSKTGQQMRLASMLKQNKVSKVTNRRVRTVQENVQEIRFKGFPESTAPSGQLNFGPKEFGPKTTETGFTGYDQSSYKSNALSAISNGSVAAAASTNNLQTQSLSQQQLSQQFKSDSQSSKANISTAAIVHSARSVGSAVKSNKSHGPPGSIKKGGRSTKESTMKTGVPSTIQELSQEVDIESNPKDFELSDAKSSKSSISTKSENNNIKSSKSLKVNKSSRVSDIDKTSTLTTSGLNSAATVTKSKLFPSTGAFNNHSTTFNSVSTNATRINDIDSTATSTVTNTDRSSLKPSNPSHILSSYPTHSQMVQPTSTKAKNGNSETAAAAKSSNSKSSKSDSVSNSKSKTSLSDLNVKESSVAQGPQESSNRNSTNGVGLSTLSTAAFGNTNMSTMNTASTNHTLSFGPKNSSVSGPSTINTRLSNTSIKSKDIDAVFGGRRSSKMIDPDAWPEVSDKEDQKESQCAIKSVNKSSSSRLRNSSNTLNGNSNVSDLNLNTTTISTLSAPAPKSNKSSNGLNTTITTKTINPDGSKSTTTTKTISQHQEGKLSDFKDLDNRKSLNVNDLSLISKQDPFNFNTQSLTSLTTLPPGASYTKTGGYKIMQKGMWWEKTTKAASQNQSGKSAIAAEPVTQNASLADKTVSVAATSKSSTSLRSKKMKSSKSKTSHIDKSEVVSRKSKEM